MTEPLGRAELELSTNQSKLDAGLKQAETKSLGFLGRVKDSFSRLSGSTIGSTLLQGIGLGAGMSAFGVIQAGLGKTVKFFGDAIGAASDLAETTNKVTVVFEDQADKILALGETSADALGMSSNAAMSAAGTYGNLFRAMGITSETSAEMSVKLVQLAADLASFNNMDPTMVLDKLRAGLSGETEPLKTLGVNLNQARIQTKAFEMGLWDGTGAISAAAKAQASYALILEDTTLAQGDFANTSDGLANTQRSLDATFQDITAELGEALLPIMTELASFTLHELVPALRTVITSLLELSGIAIKLANLAIPLLVAVIGTKLVLAFHTAKEAGVESAAAIKMAWGAALLGIPILFEFIREEQEKAAKEARSRSELPPMPWDWLIGRPESLKRSLDESTAYVAGFVAENMGGVRRVGAGLAASAPVIAAGTKIAWSPIHEQLVEAGRKAAAEALAIPGDIAKALVQGMDDVESGMTELTDLMENSLSDAAKVAYFKGVLSSQKLADGLRDERADVRAAAMQVRDNALEQLELLESGAADAAVNAGTTFAEQLRLQAVAAGQAASDIKRGVQGNMEFADEAGLWGIDIADAWSAGLVSPVSLANASARARALAGAVSPYLEGYSPPKEGPLKDIDRWGGNVIGAWIDSMLSRLGDVTSAGSKIAERARAALSIDRLAVPAFAMAAPGMGSVPAQASAAAGGGLTINGGLHLHGIGSDVSPDAARRFAQTIHDELANTLQEQGARFPNRPRVALG